MANEGSFGVTRAQYTNDGELISEGEKTKIELGMLATVEWKTEIMKNIQMANKLILYSDYLNNYGNVDIDWEISFDLTINEYVTANIGSHFIFDDDVKQKADVDNDGVLDILGPRLQVKQVLGVGFLYNF